MTSALTFTQDVTVGFAQLLADDPGSPFTYRDDAAYTDDELGIWLGKAPLATPDRALVLMFYPLSADATLSQAVGGLQARSRGARDAGMFDASGIDDAVQDALGGRFPLTLPNGIRVPSLVWSSGGWLGTDDSNRDEFSSNFTCGVGRPGTHRH